MTAPKPKVWLHSGDWMWRCGCGYIEKSGSWERAIRTSTDHSMRLHAKKAEVDIAFDWSTYRRDYGPHDLGAAHKAFVAGWKAGYSSATGSPVNDSGPVR